MEFINLKHQYHLYQNEIDQAIKDVLESGLYIMGEAIQELENELASFTKSKYCLGVSSGTDGLLLALKAMGIQRGDEVICVPFTWISPVECIRRLGGKPVFVDIDPETFLMDVNQIESAITSKTKAIIPVSLYGQMPDFKKINDIAKKYNLYVIEDGAQSFGAEQNGIKSCNACSIGVTSFFPTKPLACYGDGGAVFTNNNELAEKMFAIRVHGAPKRYDHQYIGQNARLDTLQAAILLAKLPHFKEEVKKRQKIGQYFNQHLREHFIVPETRKGNTHVFANYVLRDVNRDKVISHLSSQGIPAAIYYPICIHEQPAYLDLGYEKGDFPHAEQVANEVFSIPMHPFLTQKEQDQIINALKSSILQKI